MVNKPKASTLRHDYLGLDVPSLKHSLANRLAYSIGKDSYTATDRDWFHTVAYAVRDRLIERWMETQRSYYRADAKRIYYFSLEFLIGRTLMNSVLNMQFDEEVRQAMMEIGLDLDEIREIEHDAALGNGGLGRLAACLLDSMATLRLPGYGYGIRYEYGMFNQRIHNGQQVEQPENWLRYGNPWEFPRPEVIYPVHFNGHVVQFRDEQGRLHHHWVDTDQVMAMAYDTPIPGYGTNTVNNMRLWAAKAARDFDLAHFNEGNYIRAVEDKNTSENLSKVLYPDDSTATGRALRLKQQYFFVSASLQDILFRYQKFHPTFDELPDKVAVQLNDTHPAVSIPELMRLLVDIHKLEWDRAWGITVRTFSYTNHTLMPEALETWPVRLFAAILPRHLEIIYEINQQFLDGVRHRHPGDAELVKRMSLIDDRGDHRVRMAHLAIVGSHHVNGVSRIHTQLMQGTIFSDFDLYYPGKIINITNGVTPRRWLNQANPRLSKLICSRIGHGWLTDLNQLSRLAPLAEDAAFRTEFRAVKHANKEELAGLMKKHLGLEISADTLFDVQVKRIHEYKRQLLNVLHVVARYNRIRAQRSLDIVPRTVIFSGKAAPGYAMAKLIIRLINNVADVINNDPAIGSRLKVVFVPNYDVTTAADIIPAADLSEQISTSGTEASGTGNMKLALNGALTIGTLDGANVEMLEEVGKDNIFIFGLTAADVAKQLQGGYDPQRISDENPELRQVLDMIGSGYFSPSEPELFRPIVDTLTRNGDHFLLLADYAAYISTQERVDALYRDPEAWTRAAVLNVAHMGKFSSDRTVGEYAEKVWGVKPVAHD